MNQPLQIEETELELDEEIAIAAAPEDIRVELAAADRKRGIEAVLFAAPSAMTAAAIGTQLKLTTEEVEMLLSELQTDYAPRGVQLQQNAGRWHFQTATDLAPHLTFVKTKPIKLSRAAMESLAVIAYHQPLTRTEIENIRGVAIHKGTLDLLLETGWIKPGKRREVPGRPLTWVTTDAFLEHFGLAALKELPGVTELKATGLLDRRPAIALVPDRDDTPEPEAQADAEDLSDFIADEE
jgi:segregation and condensation protein B